MDKAKTVAVQGVPFSKGDKLRLTEPNLAWNTFFEVDFLVPCDHCLYLDGKYGLIGQGKDFKTCQHKWRVVFVEDVDKQLQYCSQVSWEIIHVYPWRKNPRVWSKLRMIR